MEDSHWEKYQPLQSHFPPLEWEQTTSQDWVKDVRNENTDWPAYHIYQCPIGARKGNEEKG